MSEDWDLFAVVRSCSSLATTTSINARVGDGYEDNEDDDDNDRKPKKPLSNSLVAGFSFDRQEQQQIPFTFPNRGDRDRNRERNRDMDSYNCDELQDSCKPFLPIGCSSSSSSPSSLVPAVSNVLKQEQGNEQNRKALGGVRVFPSSATTIPPVFVFRGQREDQQQQQQQVPGRSRKRKNQQKRTICHVTQENLSSDMWAWRKYGQKPIKGSPYPRNYYRCSSSKGCLARKQVERSNLDPNIFIVTYTGDHTHPRPTHRNSLAGSTRNKPQPANPTRKPDPESGRANPGSVDAAEITDNHNLSPTTPLKEEDEEAQGTHGDEDISQENEDEMQDDDDDDDDDVHDGDDDDDDGHDLLIPNLAVRDRDDLFSDMQGFAGTYPSWPSGGSAAAGDGGR